MRIRARKQVTQKGCTAACVEMVTRSMGAPIEERKIISDLGGPRRFGVCTVELAQYLSQRGFCVACSSIRRKGALLNSLPPSLRLLEDQLKQGYSPIVTVDPGCLNGSRATRNFHSLIVTRVSSRTCEYIDPLRGERLKLKLRDFFESWSSCAKRASAHLLVIKSFEDGITTESTRRLRPA